MPSARWRTRSTSGSGAGFPPQDALRQVVALLLSKRVEVQGGGATLAPHPERPAFEQFRTGEKEQQDGPFPDPVCRLFQVVQGDVFGRVHVLEDEEQRGAPGQRLEEDAHAGKEDLPGEFASLRAQSEHRQERRGRVGDLELTGRLFNFAPGDFQRVVDDDPVLRADGLGDCPEGHAGPVGDGAAGEDRQVGNARAKLPDQSGLSHAGRPEDRERVSASLTPHSPDVAGQQAQFFLPAYEGRRPEGPLARREDLVQLPRREGLLPSLHRQWRERPGHSHIAQRNRRAVCQQNLPRFGVLL